jgi:RNA polymerase sigma-70 factor, ECF subfamily
MLATATSLDGATAQRLEPHRRTLTAHCYRMLGSAFEADDAVQETMLRAWRGIDRYEGRGTFEAWLFRIATNVCLNMLRGRGRRALPMDLGPAAAADAVPQAVRPAATWITPVPDAWVLGSSGEVDPADAAVARESLRLAFVTALQRLPARQRAVLILRDVLRWSTAEVAALLATSDVSVKSALQRARATMAEAGVLDGPASAAVSDGAGGSGGGAAAGLLAQYVDAFERYDIDALVALLHDDATMSMPPFDLWLDGAAPIEAWWRRELAACRGSRLVAVRANGGVAAAQYRPAAGGGHEPFALHVLDVTAGRIASLHAFIDPALFPLFGMAAFLNF